MVTRSLDVRKKALNPIPISYLIQTANRFDCDIFVTDDKKTANLKHYEEMKNLSLKYRGSENQRVIDVKKSLQENKVVLINAI